MPQDEYIESGRLAAFVSTFGITHVFSVSPPSEWHKLYPGIDTAKVRFEQTLTGYIDDGTREHIENLAGRGIPRVVDIGYRAYSRPWLGRQGQLKLKLGSTFKEAKQTHGLNLDISTRYGDTLLGDSWYLFLLRCKYTLGVEGGSSLLDVDGSLNKKTEDYVTAHPGASFLEVEAKCFPGLDGTLSVSVLSPRHLECCITRTCQILVSGTYNGVLQAGRHYIELRPDFSNLDEVLAAVRDDSLREDITERAYRDVVVSKQYSYREFVGWVMSITLQSGRPPDAGGFRTKLGNVRCEGADRASWVAVIVLGRLKFIVQRGLFRLFSENLVLGAWRKLLTRHGVGRPG